MIQIKRLHESDISSDPSGMLVKMECSYKGNDDNLQCKEATYGSDFSFSLRLPYQWTAWQHRTAERQFMSTTCHSFPLMPYIIFLIVPSV